ncbi:hypothetical protein [Streptomyces sp. NPDC020298]|uniref:hypothetical protein n=1 Tax=unclassified Streptomyces TaxID=2593676 RepID=UPI0033FB1B0E
MILESLAATVPCADCAGEAAWQGVQALVGDSLRWDTEVVCRDCGSAMAICGGELPAPLRERMLAEHGRTVLRLEEAPGAPVAPGVRVAVMRVLRTALGVPLADVRDVLERVLSGEYGGTLPETEWLARRLRAAGVGAVAVRVGDGCARTDEFSSPPGSWLP